MKKNALPSQKAFTLLELLIVMLVMTLFLGLSYGRYRDFARRQEIVIAKREIVSDMREAQKNAVSGNKPDGCITPLIGYHFEVISSGPPAQYRIYIRCESNANDYEEEIITLGSNIVISMPSVNPIIFRPLALGTNIVAGSPETLTITNPAASSLSTTVVITQSGEIE